MSIVSIEKKKRRVKFSGNQINRWNKRGEGKKKQCVYYSAVYPTG